MKTRIFPIVLCGAIAVFATAAIFPPNFAPFVRTNAPWVTNATSFYLIWGGDFPGAVGGAPSTNNAFAFGSSAATNALSITFDSGGGLRYTNAYGLLQITNSVLFWGGTRLIINTADPASALLPLLAVTNSNGGGWLQLTADGILTVANSMGANGFVSTAGFTGSGAPLTNLVTSRLIAGANITFGTNNPGQANETLTITGTAGAGGIVTNDIVARGSSADTNAFRVGPDATVGLTYTNGTSIFIISNNVLYFSGSLVLTGNTTLGSLTLTNGFYTGTTNAALLGTDSNGKAVSKDSISTPGPWTNTGGIFQLGSGGFGATMTLWDDADSTMIQINATGGTNFALISSGLVADYDIRTVGKFTGNGSGITNTPSATNAQYVTAALLTNQIPASNVVSAAAVLTASSQQTNYTIPLLPGPSGNMLTIYTANTNCYLQFTGTNQADWQRTVLFRGWSNSVTVNITYAQGVRTNFNLNNYLTNGFSKVLNFYNPDTYGTNLMVSDAGGYQ